MRTPHEFCWNAGMCTASERDPKHQHGNVCRDLVERDAEHEAERDRLRNALEVASVELRGIGGTPTWDICPTCHQSPIACEMVSPYCAGKLARRALSGITTILDSKDRP